MYQQVLEKLEEANELTMEVFVNKRADFCLIVLPLGQYKIAIRDVVYKTLHSRLVLKANGKQAEELRLRILPLVSHGGGIVKELE